MAGGCQTVKRQQTFSCGGKAELEVGGGARSRPRDHQKAPRSKFDEGGQANLRLDGLDDVMLCIYD